MLAKHAYALRFSTFCQVNGMTPSLVAEIASSCDHYAATHATILAVGGEVQKANLKFWREACIVDADLLGLDATFEGSDVVLTDKAGGRIVLPA